MQISVIVCASFCLLSTWSLAGVYDDVKVWWHFDGDINTNGVVDSGEVRDQVGWGTLATPQSGRYHATTVYGLTNSVVWTNVSNSSLSSAWDCGGTGIAFIPTIHPTNSTLASPSGFLVPNLAVQGSCTVVMRLWWNGFLDPSKARNAWIYNNAFTWNNSGWLMGINDAGVPAVYCGDTNGFRSLSSPLADNTVRSNEWFDIAIVMTAKDGVARTNDLFEFYVWNKSGVMTYQSRTANFLSAPITASKGSVVGAENTTAAYASGNAFKSFRGTLAHLAVWSRPLSKDEVLEAVYYPTQLIQMGLRNSSDSEFVAEAETPQNWMLGEPWWKFRRAVSASYPLKQVSFFLPSSQSGLDYVLNLRSRSVGTNSLQTALLKVVVNQYTNAVQPIVADHDYYWFISRTQLVANATNTLSFHYAGGDASWITFDTLNFGGSWQVGIENSNNVDFRAENLNYTNYYVSLRGLDNWTNLVNRAISASVSNLVIRFRIPAELTTRYDYQFMARAIAQSNPSNTVSQHPWSISVNGQSARTYSVPNGVVVTSKLDRSVFVVGENNISLSYLGPVNNFTNPLAGGWVQFDYYRLSIVERPKGSLCIVR